ncbi:type 1 glutamine amidotransferase domain-containing protein [Coprobacter tertius]|uniref:Type 1 glutamine amidotransferase domain-containing protein n=1 Tax=Coprobacter tertius TaxID=2944915 RepID=A0ABT1MJH7_9BACT|nr:type 1 glutamine amidotransferase domain-containing protein [Coprobacter tertius]MCP9612765.1 type 1 glutamine amidotransferase domain-containing protein [Coprobacter tertius]
MLYPNILIVVTGTGIFANGKLSTGLWLSEITHIYHSAEEQKYKITIANPKGGSTPVDPESLKPFVLDKLSEEYWKNSEFKNLLKQAKSLNDISDQQFDCIYLAGGHGAMYDFPDNIILQEMIKKQYESNRIVSAICHGVCGLLNVKLSDGEYLIRNKKITGFSWFEESIARRKKEVPFDLEALLKGRGADYEKALVPMTSKVVVDDKLITGQNPFSSKEMSKAVIQHLNDNIITNK